MDYRCSDGRCSFEIEHRADYAKVSDMHEARARKLSDRPRTLIKPFEMNTFDTRKSSFDYKKYL